MTLTQFFCSLFVLWFFTFYTLKALHRYIKACNEELVPPNHRERRIMRKWLEAHASGKMKK